MAGVTHGEWWRLITAAFLHYGPLHLGLNMLALYWYGPVLEQIIGRWRYLLLYLVAGLAGSAGALYVSPNDITVGASGAIFGVLGALLVLERRGMISSGGQILMLIVLNLVFTVAVPGHLDRRPHRRPPRRLRADARVHAVPPLGAAEPRLAAASSLAAVAAGRRDSVA